MGRAREQSREDWVAQWRASGLSGRRFAEQHGLRASTLYQWAHRIGSASSVARGKARGHKRAELAFAEIKIRGEGTADESGVAPSRGVIEIVSRSGWVVRVPRDVDASRLRAVLEVVEQC